MNEYSSCYVFVLTRRLLFLFISNPQLLVGMTAMDLLISSVVGTSNGRLDRSSVSLYMQKLLDLLNLNSSQDKESIESKRKLSRKNISSNIPDFIDIIT